MRRIINSILSALLATQIGCPATTSRQAHCNGCYTTASFKVKGTGRTPDLESRLQLIADVKNFVVHELGMSSSRNYMEYREKDARTVYRLYITPKDELPDEDETWVYIRKDEEHRQLYDHSVVLHSSIDDLLDEADFYGKSGYDIRRREVQNFSDSKGCNLTPDFVSSSVAYQAKTIIHEDWHYTYQEWNKGVQPDSEINESSATVIGYAGAVEFTEKVYGAGSKAHKEAVNNYYRWKEYASVVTGAYNELERIYNSNISEKKKMKRRKRLFRRLKWKGYNFNNATLWADIDYAKHFHLVDRAYRKAGSLKGLLNVMKACPGTEWEAVRYLNWYLKDS